MATHSSRWYRYKIHKVKWLARGATGEQLYHSQLCGPDGDDRQQTRCGAKGSHKTNFAPIAFRVKSKVHDVRKRGVDLARKELCARGKRRAETQNKGNQR